jgi:hypothetical protein
MVIESRMVRWAGHVACMVEIINACKVLVRELEGKRLLLIHRHRWEHNLSLNLKDTVWEVVDCVHLVRTENSVGVL